MLLLFFSCFRWAGRMQHEGRPLQRVEPWCDVPSHVGSSTRTHPLATPQLPPLRKRWTPGLGPESCNGKGYAHYRIRSTRAHQMDSRLGLLLQLLWLQLCCSSCCSFLLFSANKFSWRLKKVVHNTPHPHRKKKQKPNKIYSSSYNNLQVLDGIK